MKKLFLCAALTVVIALKTLSVFALDADKLITDVSVLSAKLYLSDWEDSGVVLKEVKPLTPGDEAVASELEYTFAETFDGNIRNGRTGEWLDLESLAWFLDMEVNVTAARLAGGQIRIISVVTK